MPEGPIQFGTQESGHEALAGAPAIAMNVLLDARGALMRRPGIAAPSNLTADTVDADGLVGLYHPQDGVTDMLAVGNGARRQIYRLTGSGAPSLSLGTGAEDDLAGRKRPVFGETEAMVVIAGGSHIQRVFTAQWPFTNTPYLSRRLANAPEATHVLANGQRVVCNDVNNPDRVSYSNQSAGDNFSGHENWTVGIGTAGNFAAEGIPDPIRGLYQGNRELAVFGATTLEMWLPDPLDVYAPLPTQEYGLAAPYSVIKVDRAFAWWDHRRRILLGDGRQAQPISAPIQRTLDEMTAVDDVFGFRMMLGPADCLVWVAPTDGRTFVYQIGGGWAQWAGWSGTNWSRFIANCHTKRHDTGENVVGTTAGKLGVLSFNSQTDLGDAIRAYATSGYINRGTGARKRCRHVRLAFQRRGLAGSSEAEVHLSYRDDLTEWSGPLRLRFAASDPAPVVVLDSLGDYRMRDWRLDFSDAQDLVLAGAQEEFDILSS